MMHHHFHPSSRNKESSIDDVSLVDDDGADYKGDYEEEYPSRDAQLTFIPEHSVVRGGEYFISTKRSNAVEDLDDLCPRSSKRYQSDATTDIFSSQTAVDPYVLRLPQAANISGN
jgi:hypothetical protein